MPQKLSLAERARAHLEEEKTPKNESLDFEGIDLDSAEGMQLMANVEVAELLHARPGLSCGVHRT